MYKGFLEDLEYVAGLFFKPFEDCCAGEDSEDEDKGKEHNCGLGCDGFACCRDSDDDDEDDEEDEQSGPSIMSEGPVADLLKCLFEASDTDYDYED
ncbi:MAG: hypothetical protein E7219_06405 [Clostridiales bacterium]|jgi:hypothetical protein|nr:hypothetical protein [Clostridiales bacterium]